MIVLNRGNFAFIHHVHFGVRVPYGNVFPHGNDQRVPSDP